MDWHMVATELVGTIIAGIFGPPLIAVILATVAPLRPWLKKAWVVATLTTISVATVISVAIWIALPQKPYPVVPMKQNSVAQNTLTRPLLVTVQCGASPLEKQIEGYVGKDLNSLAFISSLNGGTRISITFVVPAGWFFRVTGINLSSNLPVAEGECPAEGWRL